MPAFLASCILFGASFVAAPVFLLVGIVITVFALCSRSVPQYEAYLGIRIVVVSILISCLLYSLSFLIAASPISLVGLGILAVPIFFWGIRWLSEWWFTNRPEKPPGGPSEEIEQDNAPPSPPASQP